MQSPSGYEMLQQDPKMRSSAKKCLKNFPSSYLPAAVWLRLSGNDAESERECEPEEDVVWNEYAVAK